MAINSVAAWDDTVVALTMAQLGNSPKLNIQVPNVVVKTQIIMTQIMFMRNPAFTWK